GPLPNPTTNNFLNVTGGATTLDLSSLLTINRAAASFAAGPCHNYQIVGGAGDQSGLTINNQAQFTPIGFAANNFSLTGNAAGAVFLNFTATPVPETALLLA